MVSCRESPGQATVVYVAGGAEAGIKATGALRLILREEKRIGIDSGGQKIAVLVSILGSLERHLSEGEQYISVGFSRRRGAVEDGYCRIGVGLKVPREAFAMQNDPGSLAEVARGNHVTVEPTLDLARILAFDLNRSRASNQ